MNTKDYNKTTIMKDWNRLEEVIKHAGMTVNRFALHVGLKRSENLYQIKKGNHGISKALADVICSHYPEINRGWLLTGEGNMINYQQKYPNTELENIYLHDLITEFVKADGRESYGLGDVVMLFHSFLTN